MGCECWNRTTRVSQVVLPKDGIPAPRATRLIITNWSASLTFGGKALVETSSNRWQGENKKNILVLELKLRHDPTLADSEHGCVIALAPRVTNALANAFGHVLTASTSTPARSGA